MYKKVNMSFSTTTGFHPRLEVLVWEIPLISSHSKFMKHYDNLPKGCVYKCNYIWLRSKGVIFHVRTISTINILVVELDGLLLKDGAAHQPQAFRYHSLWPPFLYSQHTSSIFILFRFVHFLHCCLCSINFLHHQITIWKSEVFF